MCCSFLKLKSERKDISTNFVPIIISSLAAAIKYILHYTRIFKIYLQQDFLNWSVKWHKHASSDECSGDSKRINVTLPLKSGHGNSSLT